MKLSKKNCRIVKWSNETGSCHVIQTFENGTWQNMMINREPQIYLTKKEAVIALNQIIETFIILNKRANLSFSEALQSNNEKN